MLEQITAIIPVGPQDESWRNLLPDLDPRLEIILVGTTEAPLQLGGARWVVAPVGRATQLNAGAAQATRPFLWFIHADTRLHSRALNRLCASLATAPNALHYFALRFLNDGPRWMPLTVLGTLFRSRVLRLPFGDQAFCLARSVLEKLGGFREDVPYGEDHALVWAAHFAGVPLRAVGASVCTSARKYSKNGWWKTTLRHWQMTLWQALQEVLT